MTNRKLDMGQAWTQATGLIGANRDLVAVMAGIFLFIPFFVLIMALIGSDFDPGSGRSGQPDPEQIAAQITAVFLNNWWALLLASVGQLCGSVAILALLGDRSRPTVGEALKRVPELILPMLGVQLLVALVTQGPSLLADRLPATAATMASIIILPLTLYLTVKFSLANVVVVLQRRRNPVTAMRESWLLTKANSFRIFVFLFMLTLLALIIGLILAMVVGLVLAALGERLAMIGNAAFIAALATTFYTLFYALTVSIYHQLAASASQAEVDLFD